MGYNVVPAQASWTCFSRLVAVNTVSSGKPRGCHYVSVLCNEKLNYI